MIIDTIVENKIVETTQAVAYTLTCMPVQVELCEN